MSHNEVIGADGRGVTRSAGVAGLQVDVEPAAVGAGQEVDQEEVFVVVMAAEKPHATGAQVILDLPFHTRFNAPLGRAGSPPQLRIP